MLHLNSPTWLMLLGLLFPLGLWAQTTLAPQVTSSGGGSASAGGVTLSFTLGQAVSTTASGNGTTLTQGFHQPPVVEAVSREDDVPSAGQLVLYPNPSSGESTLLLELANAAKVQLGVYDAVGKLVYKHSHDLSAGQHRLPLTLNRLSAGAYTLRVSSEATELDGQFRKLIIVR